MIGFRIKKKVEPFLTFLHELIGAFTLMAKTANIEVDGSLVLTYGESGMGILRSFVFKRESTEHFTMAHYTVDGVGTFEPVNAWTFVKEKHIWFVTLSGEGNGATPFFGKSDVTAFADEVFEITDEEPGVAEG